MLTGQSLTVLVGFRWSFPSPIEWGLFVISGFLVLQRKIPIFESYYLSLLAGIGGGCIYEILNGIPYWIRQGFGPWNAFNVSLYKVFLVDFQVLALPVLFWILGERFNYRISNKLKFVLAGTISFYMFKAQIAPFFHQMGNFGGNGMWGWVMRIPVAVFLYLVLLEVSENE